MKSTHKTNKTNTALCGLLSGLLLLAAGTAQTHASLIIPTSYSYDIAPGIEGGGFSYPDSGGELTDGNLGNINSYPSGFIPFAGWLNTTATTTFQFGAPVSVGSVSIDFARYQSASIYLPSSVVIGSTTFSLAGTEIADETQGFLTFGGPWSGNSLDVKFVDNPANSFTFVSEVRFDTVVPEPTSALLLLGSGAMLLLRRRRPVV